MPCRAHQDRPAAAVTATDRITRSQHGAVRAPEPYSDPPVPHTPMDTAAAPRLGGCPQQL